MTRVRIWLAAALWLLAAAAPGQVPGVPAAPQKPAAETPLSAETLRELVATIQDPAKREVLVQQLQGLLAAKEASQAKKPADLTVIEQLSAFFRSITDRLSDTANNLVKQVSRVPDGLRIVWSRLSDPATRGDLLLQIGAVLAVIVAALVAGALSWWMLRRLHHRLGRRHRPTPLGPLMRLVRLAVRLGVDVLPSAAMLASTAVLVVLPIEATGRAVAIAIVSAMAVQGLVRAVITAIFAADAPDIRLPPLDDTMATDLTRSLRKASALGVYGYFGLVVVKVTGGDEALLDPLRNLYALALLIVGIVLVMKFRSRFRAAMTQRQERQKQLAEQRRVAAEQERLAADPAKEGSDEALVLAEAEPLPDGLQGPTPPPDVVAEIESTDSPSYWRSLGRLALSLWWVVALVYIVGLYMLWVSGIDEGFGTALQATALTVMWIVIGIVAASLVHGVLLRLENAVMAWLEALPPIRKSIPRYIGLLRVACDVAIVVVVLGFVLEAWGIRAVNLLDSLFLRDVLSTALLVLVIILLALATIDISTALAQAYLERKERSSQGSGKVRTLVPLANKAIKSVVTVLAGLMVLSQLGVAIAPILASVGVLGLAVGFGAQTLVKDIITGVFILIEDTVSVGDVVDIGGTGGLVEAINIRTIQLRDLSGNLHTIPYGTVGMLTNFTKEYGRYLIECGVAYREDVDHVISVLRQLGEELQRDPAYGPKILEPIEILGLDRFEDSAVVIRARLKTKPIEQWGVGREFNRRMKKRFDELGIEIPFPHRTIYVGEDKQGQSPPLHVVREDGARSEGEDEDTAPSR